MSPQGAPIVASIPICAFLSIATAQVPLVAPAQTTVELSLHEHGRIGLGAALEASRVLSVGLGLLLLAYLVIWFRGKGFPLTLGVVNWSFVGAGLVLAHSPRHCVDLILGGGLLWLRAGYS